VLYTVLFVLCDAPLGMSGGVCEPRGVGGLLVAEYDPDNDVTRVSQGCHKGVTRVSEGCVTRVLQGLWC
jgi:hypothetical protein